MQYSGRSRVHREYKRKIKSAKYRDEDLSARYIKHIR